MKNVLKLFVAFIAIGLLTFGCKKDDVKKNFLKIGDTEYELTGGSLKNWYGDATSYNLDLRLFTSGIQFSNGGHTGTGQLIYFEMYTTDGLGLDAGDYVYDAAWTENRGTFDYSWYDTNYNNGTSLSTLEITSGTVTVNKSGSIYEIEFNGADENGKVITGYYKGEIPVFNSKKSAKVKEDKRN
jgi:hypothetical protein